jgi:ribosomal protein S18 acetylase RimI-like enzyme
MTVVVERVVSAAECADARELARAHARYERSPHGIPDDWAERMSTAVAAGHVELFVARRGPTAVGYATMTCVFGTWAVDRYAHLDCLFVAEGHRDAGVGRMLVEAVVARGRERRLGELQWQTPAWNEDAIRFYRRLGPRQQAKERFFLPLV